MFGYYLHLDNRWICLSDQCYGFNFFATASDFLFLRPHITKRSEGKIQWANAKNFIFLFLSLTYAKEERCFYRVLENNFLFLRKKIAIRLHFLKSYSFAIDNIELLLVLIIRIIFNL